MRSTSRERSTIDKSIEKFVFGRDVTQPLLLAEDVAQQQGSGAQQKAVPSTTLMTSIYAAATVIPPIASMPPAVALADSASTTAANNQLIEETKPISSKTEHLLIGAGSAAITLAVAFVVFIIWRKKNKQKKARMTLSTPKMDRDKDPQAVSIPLGSNWGSYSWDDKATYQESKSSVDQAPEPAYLRPGTSQSNRAVPTKAPFQPPNLRSTPSPPPVAIPPIHQRNPSHDTATSSPILPMQRPPSGPSSTSHSSSIPPYLAHMGGSPNTGFQPPKMSRFSWTNSQAPRTPIQPPQFPDNTRFSNVSAAESVTRYRTVESWVGQQAGRYEEARIQDRIQLQIDDALNALSDNSNSIRNSSHYRNTSYPTKFNNDNSPPINMQNLQPPPIPQDRRPSQQSFYDEEEDQLTELIINPDTSKPAKGSVTRTASKTKARHGSDATIFNAHPGTKVEIPSGSHIPSVILDGKLVSRDPYQRRDSYGN